MTENSQSRKRRFFRINQTLRVVLGIALAVMLALFAKKYHLQWDWTETGAFTLSEQTLKLLQGLTEPVSVTTFFKKGSPEEAAFKDLMTVYRYKSDKLSVTEVNPDQNPSLVKEYGIREYGVMVLAMGARHVEIKDVSESSLTAALIQLVQNKITRIRVLSGHGERSLEDKDAEGLTLFAEDLGKGHYELKSLNLLQEARIPEDVDVLIIPTPTHPLLPPEAAIVKDYLGKEGARALILLDPAAPDSSGRVAVRPFAFLEGLPVRQGGAVVIDPASRLFGGDYAVPVVTQYPPHAITEGLKVSTFFPLVQPLLADAAPRAGNDADDDADAAWQTTPLAETGPAAWGETGSLKQEVDYDEGVDHKGPMTIAYALEKQKVKQESSQQGSEKGATPRIVVVGDGDFMANAYYEQAGNRDLVQNMIHWLSSDEHLIAAHPKDKVRPELYLTPLQGRMLFVGCVLLVPLALVGAALVAWRRRRRK